MANKCDFFMTVRGSEKNILAFKDMMKCNGLVYMGSGVCNIYFEEEKEIEDGLFRCKIYGALKWSVKRSLVNDAISMRTKPDKWRFGENVDKTKLTFLTLFEACKSLELNMECYSQEYNMCFQEHYLFVNGELLKDEKVDWMEVFDEEKNKWVSVGGFENWDFTI